MPTIDNTYTKIATVTVGAGGISSIDFPSIPATYTDLKLVFSLRTSNDNGGRDYIMIRFNGSGSSYSYKWLGAYDNNSLVSGSSASTDYQKVFVVDANDSGSNIFGNGEIYIPNYTTSGNKVSSANYVSENNTTSTWLNGLNAGLWSNSSAINQITIYPYSPTPTGTFVQYSTATLYGIKSSSITAKATGGTVTTDGTYWYHSFYTSGVFTPSQSLTADYLVVAGGGGSGQTSGGGWNGGCGGAGGYRNFTSQSFTATNYAVTIGAGGAAGAYSAGGGNYGANGGSSSVIGGAISISASGGGGGGTTGTNGKVKTSGRNGGSGGGSAQDTTSNSGGTGNSGGYSPVEGYAGGSVNGSSPYVAGQGGGSSGVGAQSDSVVNNYTSNSISGTATNYARGGSRGAIAGDNNASPNTGYGANSNQTGSSGNNDSPGWNGGSGIVIIRYAV